MMRVCSSLPNRDLAFLPNTDQADEGTHDVVVTVNLNGAPRLLLDAVKPLRLQ
jgi:hypothetical protein